MRKIWSASVIKGFVKKVVILVMFAALLSYFYNPVKTNAYFLSNKVQPEGVTITRTILEEDKSADILGSGGQGEQGE